MEVKWVRIRQVIDDLKKEYPNAKEEDIIKKCYIDLEKYRKNE